MTKKLNSDPLHRKIIEPTPSKTNIINDMIRYGNLCAANGLIYGNFGNLSVKYEKSIYITRSGSMMCNIISDDIIVFDGDHIPSDASSDTPIHWGIYNKIGEGAILHMHGDFTIVLSLLMDRIKPIDFVGEQFLGEIPIVEGKFGSSTLNNQVVNNIQNNAVIVRGHGSFTIAENIRKAFALSCALETSCRLLYYKNNYRIKKMED